MKDRLAQILIKTIGTSQYESKFSFYYPAAIFKPNDKKARDGIMTISRSPYGKLNDINVSFELLVDARAELDFETGKSSVKKTNASYEFKAMAANLNDRGYNRKSYLDVIEIFLDTINESHELLNKAKKRNLDTTMRIKGVHLEKDELVYEMSGLSSFNFPLASETPYSGYIVTTTKSDGHFYETFGFYKKHILNPGKKIEDYLGELQRITSHLEDLNIELARVLNAPINDEQIIDLFATTFSLSDSFRHNLSYPLERIDGGFIGKVPDRYERSSFASYPYIFKLFVETADRVTLELFENNRHEPQLIKTLADITPFAAKKFTMQLDLKMQENRKAAEALRRFIER
ncbi:hypothetical protein HO924_10545 [Streptococcus suis]|nr:hypothetical protein [Streptococcus suis]